ncbi:RipA family octameric membrane protein [Teredinibacter purpureus]|uniref:RipA family octameric membrane protein n=1 Tax=Teredinibacter purpureus TaxID=2731756 RepID=UPI0005F81B9F|nr:hypothetical protein [Teredinibacter purpureus]
MNIREKDELSKMDAITLLMERSHAEAQLFWQRNNFLFLTNTALLGAAFYYFFINVPVDSPSSEIKTVVSISGLYVSLIWFLFNKVGRRMNHVYMQDAKNIATSDPLLLTLFENSLGDKVPSEAVSKAGRPLVDKINHNLSATMVNYTFIAGFLAGWVYVLLRPIGS